MLEIVSGAEHATFINTFRCEPSNQAEVVGVTIDIVDQVAARFPLSVWREYSAGGYYLHEVGRSRWCARCRS
jgi:hypothetical protein